ncbi:MAG: glycosyltransferase family A protein [Coleofasciculus sp. D1-CHI-01]|uniref:glycosyltransferase family 2 protein n=1 Tax=Coleofasciculus sp. D1-CHI-01 TaxID=3068482 RepID=UPI0032F2A00D
MSSPLVSIVIPTRDRPQLLPYAVKSALAQTQPDIEVIVVDDGSLKPVELSPDPRLKIINLKTSRGGAAARNVGTEMARGKWITYLDDDDCLLPHMVEVSLDALTKTTHPSPVGVISGIEVVNLNRDVLTKRLPPPIRLKGCHFSLENLEPGKTYTTKQTLVVEREVINQIGGWDESFRSRVHTELFLRLNVVCTIIGLPVVTYQLLRDQQARVSRDPNLRQESFYRLIEKHHDIFKAHPKMFSEFVYQQALTSYEMGQEKAALNHFIWALELHPTHILGLSLRTSLARLTHPLKVPV